MDCLLQLTMHRSRDYICTNEKAKKEIVIPSVRLHPPNNNSIGYISGSRNLKVRGGGVSQPLTSGSDFVISVIITVLL